MIIGSKPPFEVSWIAYIWLYGCSRSEDYMTKVDREIVARIVGEAREALEEARSIASMGIDDFMRSRRARFSLRYSIVMLVESLADLAVAILEKDFDESPESFREAFIKLAVVGVIGASTAQSMVRLVSLRNIIVHRYWIVDDFKIYNSAERDGIKNIEKFIEEVINYVETKDP